MGSIIHNRSGTMQDRVDKACAILRTRFPSQTFTNNGEYFDLQNSSLTPALRIEASTAPEVSTILKILVEENASFAIKSGGHAVATGASNVEGGVTIDLARLNSFELSEDRKTARIGAGARWGKVYTMLDPLGLTVSGGRVSGVGVGGFLLGGGISGFSQLKGWGCDGVLSWELVLPSGAIINVNKESHPDLLWALRGAGQSNFGIVTSVVMETIELPNPRGYWVTFRIYAQDKRSQLLDHIQTEWATTDRNLFGPNFYQYISAQNNFVSLAVRGHLVHNDVNTLPASLSGLKDVSNLNVEPGPGEGHIMPVGLLSDAATKDVITGDYNQWLTLTYYPSREFDEVSYDIFEEEAVKLQDVDGLVATLTTQIMPRSEKAVDDWRRTVLAPAYEEDGGPLVLLQHMYSYKSAADEKRVKDVARIAFDRMEAKAKELDVWHPFRYLNYVNDFQVQEVWKGYGEETVNRLKEIQKGVDPAGVFTTRGIASGAFQLN